MNPATKAMHVSMRLFIVGCSRSGTTLLQGLLASHPRVYAFPETGIFLKALGMRRQSLPWTWIGLTLGKERKALGRLLRKIGRDDLSPEVPGYSLFLYRSIGRVVSVLDRIALDAGRDIWLEKTPRHYLHAGLIRGLVPESHVIHMVRDGREVVASIYDRARLYPDIFKRQRDPAYGIRAWNRAMKFHCRFAGRPGHSVVVYEKLVKDPREALCRLCDETGLAFHEEMLVPGNSGAFILPEEKWKAGSRKPIQDGRSKFFKLFDSKTQHTISRSLDMEKYAALSSMDTP